MKYLNILKRSLCCAAVIGIVLASTKTVYCTNYTSMEEYMEESNKQAEAAGYKTINTPSGTTPSLSGGTVNGSTTTKVEKNEEPVKVVESCDHSYVDSIIKEPTCAEVGMMESKCSKCGDTYKTEIPATGKHEYSSEVTKEATCTEKGVSTFTCNVCGDTYTEEIPMIEHTYESSIAEDATCTTAGTRVFICTQCDDSYTEDIPATGHVEVEEITKEAGAFTTGQKAIKCSSCGEVLSTEVIPAKHSIWYLYVAIACTALILGVLVAFIFRKKKHGLKSWSKSA